MNLKQRYLNVFVISLLVSLGTFWDLWSVFFQQDEWSGFGRVIAAGKLGLSTLFRLSGWHFTPATTLFMALHYLFFGLTSHYYAIVSLLLHALNGFLVFALIRSMLSDIRVSWLAMALFLTAHTSAQAVHWYAASMSFLPSATFGLLSMLRFTEYLKSGRPVLLVWSLVFLVVGLMFREHLLFLFAYYALLAPRLRLAVFVAAGGYLLFRLIPGTSALATSTHFEGFLDVFVSNASYLARLIFVGLPQIIISPDRLTSIGKFLFGFAGIGEKGLFYFVEDAFRNLVYLIIASTGLFIAWKRKTDVAWRTVAARLGLFTILGVIPFIALPKQVFLESRHFYFIMAGASGLLAWLIVQKWDKAKERSDKFIVAAIATLYVGLNVFMIRQDLLSLKAVSQIRKDILNQMASYSNRLPSRVLFVHLGDDMPFQSGVGQILMVKFHQEWNYSELLRTGFLFPIYDEGYRETTKGVGFGYVRSYRSAINIACQYGLKEENIFAFSWDSQKHIIQDIPPQMGEPVVCPKAKDSQT